MSATDLVIPAVADNLPSLANVINICTKGAEEDARNAMEAALLAGNYLNQAKRLVAHGEWETWLTTNCKLAVRTAQAYMRLAKRVPSLEDLKAQRVADLPVREAIKAIATSPDMPPKLDHSSVTFGALGASARVASEMAKSADAFRSAARSAMRANKITGAQLSRMRDTLTRAMELLDRLEAGTAGESEVAT